MPLKAVGVYMVPRLWFRAFNFFFISWRSEPVVSCTLAGYSGIGYYFASHLCIGQNAGFSGNTSAATAILVAAADCKSGDFTA
jgi:hypothetical protein